MDPQIIITAGGEELVVLSRRDFDSLLARLGDEEAEDRMTTHIVAESRARVASGEEKLIPSDALGRPLPMAASDFDAVHLDDVAPLTDE